MKETTRKPAEKKQQIETQILMSWETKQRGEPAKRVKKKTYKKSKISRIKNVKAQKPNFKIELLANIYD